VAYDFKLAEDVVLEKLRQTNKKAIVFNTGKLTTFARVLAKGSTAELGNIKEAIIMGGGFEGLPPFTADNPAACFGDKTLDLGGNIFSHPTFSCDTDFSTHQEFNIFWIRRALSMPLIYFRKNESPPTWFQPTQRMVPRFS